MPTHSLHPLNQREQSALNLRFMAGEHLTRNLKLPVVDPENPFGGGGAIKCSRRPLTSSNGILGRFVIYIAQCKGTVPWSAPQIHHWLLVRIPLNKNRLITRNTTGFGGAVVKSSTIRLVGTGFAVQYRLPQTICF